MAQQKDAVNPQIEQQIRILAMKYDTAINSHDPAAVAALYTQDAVWVTYHDGKYHGRQAIEHEYDNYPTTVERVTAPGNEVRSSGT